MQFSDLPDDTKIYLYNSVCDLVCYRTVDLFPRGTYLVSCIFDANDGLYATEKARKFWDLHPEMHPYSTLFGILYKKLELES